MEIKSYLTIIAKRWWVILLVVLVVGIASVYASRLIPPRYEAETSLRVVTPMGGSLGDVSYQTNYADRLMNTYAQIATSEQVLEEVKTKLNVAKLPDITVKTIPSSEIIVIKAAGSNPNLVAQTANTIADILTARSQSNVSQSDTSSEELTILNARQVEIQKELDQAWQDRENLVQANAQTAAQLGTVDRLIRMKEATYLNLQDQYQRAVINEAVAIYLSTKTPAQTTMNITGNEMASLELELASLRAQYESLSSRSATYTQQLISTGQKIQNKENAYQTLLSQIDSARIANSKHASAQDIRIASSAVPPLNPTGLSSMMIIGLGILIGLIAGILLAFLVNTLDTRILTAEQVQNLTELPILGRLPNMSRKDRKAPWASSDINLQRAIGNLCTKILAIQHTQPVKTILLTSPNPKEGKSLITLAVAEGLAKTNRKVLVVDTDWRKSGMLKLLNATTEQCGLPSLLRGQCSLEDAVQVFSNPGIHYLLSGLEDEDPNAFFTGPTFAALLQKFDAYDLVLFDSPALLAVPDAYNLALQMDSLILVIQRKHTKADDVEAMLSQLEDVKPRIMGTVINRVPIKRVSGYYQRRARYLPHFS